MAVSVMESECLESLLALIALRKKAISQTQRGRYKRLEELQVDCRIFSMKALSEIEKSGI